MCDLKPEASPDNGAWVKNATACWQLTRADHERCEITVLSLDGDARHDELLNELQKNSNNPAGLSSYLQKLGTKAMITNRSQSTPELAGALAEMPQVINSVDNFAVECVDRFLNAAPGGERFNDIEQASFVCQIGKTTGWLRMSYKVRDFLFILAIAPPNG
ncbi:hypothetical protein BPNPMPFG_002423 [Mesorhizobium sp. AR07]|uniref:hypothetical protein n=1 Tax=Mesorhizobium sp. AR07 TaxID=2865838 RepID=UPI00215F5CF7|nr:hypothetical protein [Mesorhizobium sp. AR07]UVK46719.1 hypothetical protein BPNPMPFG_002423 [Mesorhizobium sp. AR07]